MRNVLFLGAGMFVLGFDAYVVAGLLPYIGGTFHVNAAQTGFLISAFTLCYALASPIFAALLAGRPLRRLLVLALFVFSAANGLSAVAPSFVWLLVSRALAGMGAGLYSPLSSAAGAALVSAERRGRALGVILGGMSAGTVLGVPVGLAIAARVGWQGTFFTIALFGLAATAALLYGIPEIPAAASPSFRQRLAVMANRRVASTVCITFVTSVASLGLYAYVAEWVPHLTAHDSVTSYLWAWGVGGIVGSLAIGSLIDRTGRPGLLMVLILSGLAVTLAALPVVLCVPIVSFLPFVVWGALGWASQAPQQAVLIRVQPANGAASVALNSSANYLGSSVGSALGGTAMLLGLPPGHLPVAASILVLSALLGQVLMVARNAKRPMVV